MFFFSTIHHIVIVSSRILVVLPLHFILQVSLRHISYYVAAGDLLLKSNSIQDPISQGKYGQTYFSFCLFTNMESCETAGFLIRVVITLLHVHNICKLWTITLGRRI